MTMTPAELKSARRSLGISQEQFAKVFGAHDGRTVRGWEHGTRNGLPAHIPRSVNILVRLALEVPAARQWLGIAPKRAAPK
jgi:transcriptional regulator with XRE-family HTH domain